MWVHLDARRPGVSVPQDLSENPRLVLQYGYNMPIPIPDLAIDERGITATLSFSRMPHQTFIPWSAVYIISCTDGRGVVYFEDVPEEVALLGPPVDGTTGRPVEPAADAVDEAVEQTLQGGAAGADEAGLLHEAGNGVRNGGRGVKARSGRSARDRESRPILAVVPPGPEDEELGLEGRVAHARRRRPRLRLVK